MLQINRNSGKNMLTAVFRLEGEYKTFLEDAENAFPRNSHYRTFWHA
jgi:hypothetical protein